MSEERRTRRVMALVHFFDGRCEWRETTVSLPLSDDLAARGERLRRARIGTHTSLRDAYAGTGIDFPRASRIEHGHEAATEEEWRALWAALGLAE